MPSKKTTLTMDDLLAEVPPQVLSVGEVVEAKVISCDKNEVWIDLGFGGVGLVARREISPGLNLQPGDTVSAIVLDPESAEGFPVLSLKKVAKEKGWDRLKALESEKEVITVYPYSANRGGLMVEIEGVRGFLPVSQLTAQHYPRVVGADRDEILQRLNELVKKPLRVRILDLDRDQSKLIVSEKEAVREDTKARLAKIKVGDEVEAEVTGGVDFGIFVTVDGIEGLVHISEISWDRVTNPAELYQPGDKVKAKVIAVEDDKLSLSIKQLTADPWLKEVGKLKVGQSVKGKITRITPFGAFVQLTPAIEALVHVSELTGTAATKAKQAQADLGQHFQVGDIKQFKILDIEPAARKISLTIASTAARPRSTNTKVRAAAKK